MTFTDYDLKRLKERIEDNFRCGHCDKGFESEPCLCLDIDYELRKVLPALLARLEAAENERDYWRNRCASAEEKSRDAHFDLVRSGFFSERKAAEE